MKKTLIALTLLASALTGAQAGIILSDTFNYNNGLDTNSSGYFADIIAAPGSAWIANSGSTTMQVSPTNTLFITSTRSQDIYRQWQTSPSAYLSNSASVLYSSYTLNCAALPTWNGTYFSHFAGTNVYTSSTSTITGHRARVWTSLTNYTAGGALATGGQFYLNIINSAETGETPVTWTATPLYTNTTYTVVTKYVVATGQSTLWINPTYETDTSVTDTTPLPYDWTLNNLGVNFPVNGPVNISSYNFRQNGGEGDIAIGSLKVGTQFTDVAGPHTPPTLTAPVNANTPMNITIGPLAFTVQSGWEAASLVSVTANSSNTGLVPNTGIALASLAGSTNRTITLTPAPNQQGSATIFLIAYDTFNYTTNSFVLTVGVPSVAAIPNQITPYNTATPAIPFAVGDTEGDPLTLTATSSNTGLVPTSNIQVGVGVPNVSSNVVVTPLFGQSGASTITINVSDGHNTTSTSFAVTVTPAPLGLVYSEDFAYTSFAIPNSLYLASGGSGAPWEPISGTAGLLQVTNMGTSGFAYLVNTNNDSEGAAFIGAPAYDGSQGYVFYTSFTVDCTLLPTYYGTYFFHLSSSGTDTSNYRDKIYVSTQNAAPGMFRFGIANTATSWVQQFPSDLMTNTTYTVVTRYNAATGDSTLWVNPVNEQSPGVTASDAPQSSTIGGLSLRQPGDYYIGDLTIGPMKVGTQFADVVGANQYPSISVQPQSQTNNAGATVTFLVTATGLDPLRYQWLKNQTNTIAGATNAVLALSNVQSNDAAGYSVVVTNAYGATTSSVATLTVLFPPVIIQQPQDRAAVAGGTAQFSVSVTGDTNRIYQWQRGATGMLGRTNNPLVLTNIQPSDFGGYRVIVSNPSGSTTSQVAHLTVAKQPTLAPPQFNAATLYLAFPTEAGPEYLVEYKAA
jgi:hypothetical protein